jgi:undecaprenyl-diphosphatase
MKKAAKKPILEKKAVKDKVETLKKISAPKDNIPVVSQRKYTARKYVSYIILASLIAGISILTFLAKQTPYFKVDLEITREVQEFNAAWFQSIMNALTFIGNPGVSPAVVVVTVLAVYIKKRKKEAAMILFSTVGATIISSTMKSFVHRLRPSPLLIHQVTRYNKPDSFPSGHVLFYVGFFGFLFYLTFTLPESNKFRLVLLVILGLLISLIGASRIYLGAHWFSDVTGAYLIGFIWLSVVIFLFNKWQPKVVPS